MLVGSDCRSPFVGQDALVYGTPSLPPRSLLPVCCICASRDYFLVSTFFWFAGTANAGDLVLHCHERMDSLMRRVAQHFNLREHVVKVAASVH